MTNFISFIIGALMSSKNICFADWYGTLITAEIASFPKQKFSKVQRLLNTLVRKAFFFIFISFFIFFILIKMGTKDNALRIN